MRLKMITNENARDFDELLPDYFMEERELLGVACIDEGEEEDFIMGASVVQPREEDDTLEILWMYVKPECRRQGAGARMLHGIREMAVAAGLQLLDVCFWGGDTGEDLSDDWVIDPAEEEITRREAEDPAEELDEIGILRAFLLEEGFLTMSEAPIYTFRLSDVLTSDYVRDHQKNKDNKVMEAYECMTWDDAPAAVREAAREKIMEAGFRDHTGLCAPGLSFICRKGREIEGCILTTDDPAEQRITVMLLISFSGDPICTAKLIAVSGDRILESYPEDYRISFVAMNEMTLKLLNTILGGSEKVLLEGYTVRGILEA